MQADQVRELCAGLANLQPNQRITLDKNQNPQIVTLSYNCFWRIVYWLGRCVGYKNYPKIKSMVALVNRIFQENEKSLRTEDMANINSWHKILIRRRNINKKVKPELKQLTKFIEKFIDKFPQKDRVRIQREVAGKYYQKEMPYFEGLINAPTQDFECGRIIGKVRIPKASYIINEVYPSDVNEGDVYGAKIIVKYKQVSNLFLKDPQELYLKAKDGSTHAFHAAFLLLKQEEETKEKKDAKESKETKETKSQKDILNEKMILDCTRYTPYSIQAFKALVYGYTKDGNNNLIVPLADFICLWHLADHFKYEEISQLCIETFKKMMSLDSPENVFPRILDFYLFAACILKLPYQKDGSLIQTLDQSLKAHPKYEKALTILIANNFKDELSHLSSEQSEKIKGYIQAYQEWVEESTKSLSLEVEI